MTAAMPEFGAGWSALRVDDGFVLFEPVDGPGDQRPVELGSSRWCVVTSDNPQGVVRSRQENEDGRRRLREWAAGVVTGRRFETFGGVGSVSDPRSWPESELGVALELPAGGQGFDVVRGWCREFDQAAVYVFDGDSRLLVDWHGNLVRAQNYRVHRVGVCADSHESRTDRLGIPGAYLSPS